MKVGSGGKFKSIYLGLISIGILSSVYLFIRILTFHIRFTLFDSPQEFRENAIYLATNLLLQGKNPYALENLPQFAVTYGIMYNLAVLPFAKIFGSTFLIHRLISGICILLSGSLIFYWLRLEKVSKSLAFFGVSLFYFNSIINAYDILSRPDAFGFLIFLSSILIVRKFNFSPKSLLVGSALSVVGFLTKPYFATGLIFIFIYLFIY